MGAYRSSLIARLALVSLTFATLTGLMLFVILRAMRESLVAAHSFSLDSSGVLLGVWRPHGLVILACAGAGWLMAVLVERT